MLTTEQPVTDNGNTSPVASPAENGAIDKESCVLHLRRLPLDVADIEVATLAVPFGGLQNMVITKKSGQALIEMHSLEAAKLMLQYYTEVSRPFLRRQTGICEIAVQYSRYSRLSTTGGSTQLYAAINQANEQAVASQESGPKCVLHIQIECYPLQVPLSHALFYQIFARFGAIKRIIVFMVKRGQNGSPQMLFQPQALIEFDNPISAHVSKIHMNQCSFSPFGGHMLVEFSRQNSLEVRFENNLCRDYTLRPLTDMEQLALGMSGLTTEPTLYHNGGCEYLPQVFYQQQRCYTNGVRRSEPPDCLMRRPKPPPYMYPDQGILPLMHHPPTQDRFILSPNASPVLIVSKLNTEKVTPDILFTLFGVYGDVVRVKVMFSKRDTALVQFVDASQAALALENLNGCVLFGHTLKCNFSRHLHIKMPPTSGTNDSEAGPQEGEAMTKDYTDSGLHRFRRVNSRNHANIYPPSCVLHVSNLPPEWTADQVAETFEEQGHQPIQAKLMQSDKRMALLGFNSIEDAISALVTMHNYQLDPESKQRIRVCFSKIQLGASQAAKPPVTTEAQEKTE